MADDDGHLGAYVIYTRRRVVHMFWAAAANMRNYRVIQIRCRLGSAASAARPVTTGECIAAQMFNSPLHTHTWIIAYATIGYETRPAAIGSPFNLPSNFIFFHFWCLEKKPLSTQNMVLFRFVRRTTEYYTLFFWSILNEKIGKCVIIFSRSNYVYYAAQQHS